MKTKTSIFLLLATVATMRAIGETCSDDALKDEILLFMRPVECVKMVRGQPYRPRALTEQISFDGDTNRLARLLAEIAQTNNVQIAQRSMTLLGEYGTPTQLPFLCSCATNPVVGDKAVRAALRIGGVTSNSIEAAQRYFALTNTDASVGRSRTSICADLIKLSGREGVDDICRSNAMEVAQNFAFSADCNYYWLDKLRLEDDPSYRYSKRRLAFMRGAASYAAQWEFMANYATNVINELVAYPESNLPD